jgi:adenylate cyclase
MSGPMAWGRLMKFRFRVTLLTIVIGLILLTVAAVGVASFLNARSAAEEMAGQILEQTALRVDQQVDKILGEATAQTRLTLRMLETNQLRSRDFPKIVAYWKEALAVSPDVASLYLGVAHTGEQVGVSRLHGGRVTVWQSTRNAIGRLEQREFWVEDYPRQPYFFDAAKEAPDVRTRPWFEAAHRQRRAIWTDTYVYLGLEGLQTVFGLTYAVPVDNADGRLDAVVSADFDLDGLCRFLKRLRVGDEGFAFLVEVQADGGRRVIAHPRSEILLRPVPGGPLARELAPADAVQDARVQALLAKLPAGSKLKTRETVGRTRFILGGEGYLGSYRRLSGADRPRWIICTVLPEEEVMGYAHRTNRLTFVITVAALAFAVVLSLAMARRVARPLEHLARDAAAIGQFRLEEQPAVRSFVLEVDRLGVATEEMKAGLRSFGKYVPADLVRALLASGKEARLGGERRALTLFFSDIAGFTALAESLPEEALVAHLGEYLGALSAEILTLGGTVDKYIGDAIMAFWGAPKDNPGHAAAACTAALRCQRRLRELRPGWQTAGRPLCPTRIGLHTGEVIVGNIGSVARLNYTAIGDAVNLASRLEGLNKRYGTECILSEVTFRQAGAAIVARPLDWVSVAGRSAAVLIYELLGVADEVEPRMVDLTVCYTKALAAYRRQDWAGAMALCGHALELRPGDAPSRLLAARCDEYRLQPPGEGWDGVHRLTSK